MERIRNLNRYQRSILLLLAIMVLVFAVAYSVVCSRVGFLYNDEIFTVSQQDGIVIYSGTLGGVDSCFSVAPDVAVTFRYGNRVFGPYTVKEDPTAIPKEHSMREHMKGIEVRENDEIIFRGGACNLDLSGGDPQWMLINEDGSNESISIVVGNGMIDSIGQLSDQMAPSVSTVLRLINEPELTHKGMWIAYVGGVFCSIISAITILFADELFQWKMSFRIRYAYSAEPSDWEIASRYISWTLLPVIVVVIYIVGLQ